jgi:glycosyltransferase involved in cell wall biosynthesis
MTNNLSIIVPVYNEKDAIETSIQSLISLKELESEYEIEIIIVDDGSQDGTSELLEKALNENNKFILIQHLENKGYGAAIKTGISEAKFNYIAITDADETYPSERLLEFLDLAVKNRIDMVVGSRVGEKVHIPVLRRFPKMVLNLLASYLVGKKIPDLNSGLRVIKKDVIQEFLYILPDGFSLTSTITLATLTNGYNVHYEKINYSHRKGFSKIKPIADTVNFLVLIVRTVLLFKPLKIFIPLFLILFISGLSLFIFRVINGEGFAISSLILLLSSIQVLAIGMLADLLERKLSRK